MFLRPITDFSTTVWVNALRNNFVISSMFLQTNHPVSHPDDVGNCCLQSQALVHELSVPECRCHFLIFFHAYMQDQTKRRLIYYTNSGITRIVKIV